MKGQKSLNNNVLHSHMEQFDQTEGSYLVQKKIIDQNPSEIDEDLIKLNHEKEEIGSAESNQAERIEAGFQDLKCCPFLQDWVTVPDTLTFIHSVVPGMYETKILIQNMSTWSITYCVVPSSLDKFRIINTIGSISPKQKTEVIVLSRTEKVKDFGFICRERFTVFATPVYYNSQLQAKKIKLLWTAYGTDLFPYDAAETHKIKIVLPAEDSYLDNYNYMERSCLGGYIAQSDNINAAWSLRPVDTNTFLDNWTPTESNHSIEKTWIRQIRDWRSAMNVMKCETKALTYAVRVTAASAVMFGLTIAMLIWTDGSGPLSPRAHGSNGQPLSSPLPQESWWNIF